MLIKRNIASIKNSGITLIELIITLAIVSLVIAMTFSMNIFANNTFSKGIKKSDVQSTLRLAADYVTKQLRFSGEVELLPAKPADLDSDTEYIYIDSSTGSLIHYSNGVYKTIINSSGGISTNIEFQQQDHQTVYFKISSTLKGEDFSVDSSVIALNLGNNIIQGLSPSYAISFTKEQPAAFIPVTSVNISAPSSTIPTGGGTLQLSSSVNPLEASIKTVTWSVNNTSVATIDKDSGLLKTTASAASGIPIVVTAAANDGSGKLATYTVTTASPSAPTAITALSIVANDGTSIKRNKGSLQLSYNATPQNVKLKSVEWNVFNDRNASISASGLLRSPNGSNKLTANSLKVTLKVTSIDGTSISKDISIAVTNK
ncbi:Ig-like domain-containing protein [Clostridium swellfunianum]|uniref:Ig-like domain-containing protein n=1 Tax=Clostridium swellfunianum TaxID=1367462 RepID=UPI00202DCCE7|nr:Ig-like domain-containing protein [Clostridium swellfunianum]MCM0650755.1 Ig-like domain-containing protein [Clostridium swellfunianum]